MIVTPPSYLVISRQMKTLAATATMVWEYSWCFLIIPFAHQDFKQCRLYSVTVAKWSLWVTESIGNWGYSYFHSLVPESLNSSHWHAVPDRSLWFNHTLHLEGWQPILAECCFQVGPLALLSAGHARNLWLATLGKIYALWAVDSTVMGLLLHLFCSQVGHVVECMECMDPCIAWILDL